MQNTESETFWIVQAKSTERELKALAWPAADLRPWEKSLLFEVTGILSVTVKAKLFSCEETKFDRETFPFSCGSNTVAGDSFGTVFEWGKLGGQKQLWIMSPSRPGWLFILSIVHPCPFILPPYGSQIHFSHLKTVYKLLRLHWNWWIRKHTP